MERLKSLRTKMARAKALTGFVTPSSLESVSNAARNGPVSYKILGFSELQTGSHFKPLEREISLLTTYWSESTKSSR